MSATVIPVSVARNLIEVAKESLAQLVVKIINESFDTTLSAADVLKLFSSPKPEHGDVCLACFSVVRLLGDKAKVAALAEKLGFALNPNSVANHIVSKIEEAIKSDVEGLMVGDKSAIKSVSTMGAYINVMFSLNFHAQVAQSILAGEFLSRPTSPLKDKTMIEYSQPNVRAAICYYGMSHC
jgi:hypothetical protein